jgi:hypothetical protein
MRCGARRGADTTRTLPPFPLADAERWGPFIASSEVPLSSLIGPRVRSSLPARTKSESDARKTAVSSRSPVATPLPPLPWQAGAKEAAQPFSDARTKAYRLYLVKHVVIFTPLVYAIIVCRQFLATQLHGAAPETLYATRSLRLLYRGSWGLLLSAALAAAVWALRAPGDVLRLFNSPSDTFLTRLVVVDCVLSALNATSMLEFAGRREVECPRAASTMAACLLRGYWPSTHSAFITKWVGSAYPPQVVFAPELFRTASFVFGALWLVATRDGVDACFSPRFLASLALRAFISMALSMLAVAMSLPHTRFDGGTSALPPALLDATCPRPLRRARDACCAAAAATAAAVRAAVNPLPHGAQLAAATAAGSSHGGMPPIAVFALSLLIGILNNDPRLYALGRLQVGLFWGAIAIQVFASDAPPSTDEHPSSWPADAQADCLRMAGGGRGLEASQPRLSWADVESEELIGSGSYATVRAARWRGTGVALKCWLDDGGDDDESAVLAEAALLMTLRHPNVLSVYGVLPRPRALVMERGVCTLAAVLCGEEACSNGLQWKRRVDLARDVAAGVDFLHAHAPPIIHGDITCSNVLIAADGRAKLSDFGTSFVSALGANAPLSVCSVDYAAPEVLRRQPVRVPQAVDAFSFGVVCARIATAPHRAGLAAPRTQSAGSGSVPRFLHSVTTVYAAERARFQPPLPATCPEEFAAIVRACCAEAPAERPAFTQLRRDLDAAHARASTWTAPIR